MPPFPHLLFSFPAKSRRERTVNTLPAAPFWAIAGAQAAVQQPVVYVHELICLSLNMPICLYAYTYIYLCTDVLTSIHIYFYFCLYVAICFYFLLISMHLAAGPRYNGTRLHRQCAMRASHAPRCRSAPSLTLYKYYIRFKRGGTPTVA